MPSHFGNTQPGAFGKRGGGSNTKNAICIFMSCFPHPPSVSRKLRKLFCFFFSGSVRCVTNTRGEKRGGRGIKTYNTRPSFHPHPSKKKRRKESGGHRRKLPLFLPLMSNAPLPPLLFASPDLCAVSPAPNSETPPPLGRESVVCHQCPSLFCCSRCDTVLKCPMCLFSIWNEDFFCIYKVGEIHMWAALYFGSNFSFIRSSRSLQYLPPMTLESREGEKEFSTIEREKKSTAHSFHTQKRSIFCKIRRPTFFFVRAGVAVFYFKIIIIGRMRGKPWGVCVA